KRSDPTFPDKSCLRRWGNRDAMLAKLAEFCEGRDEFKPVLRILKEGVTRSVDRRVDSLDVKGFVYLLRSGKKYKLGCTNAIGRRVRELAIQLPQKPD